MAVSLNDELRVTVRFNVAGARVVGNHFFVQYIGLGGISDNDAVDKLAEWMADVFAPLDDIMDSNTALGVCQVDEVGITGVYDPDPEVNTAKVVTIRTLGTFSWAFAPAATGDQYATQIAAVGVANTEIPKVRGRKSFGGLAEASLAEAVLTSSALTKLAAGVTEWIGGPSFHDVGLEWLAGVMSLKDDGFVPFNGTGSVTNLPGNQVRRRLRRS